MLSLPGPKTGPHTSILRPGNETTSARDHLCINTLCSSQIAVLVAAAIFVAGLLAGRYAVPGICQIINSTSFSISKCDCFDLVSINFDGMRAKRIRANILEKKYPFCHNNFYVARSD